MALNCFRDCIIFNWFSSDEHTLHLHSKFWFIWSMWTLLVTVVFCLFACLPNLLRFDVFARILCYSIPMQLVRIAIHLSSVWHVVLVWLVYLMQWMFNIYEFGKYTKNGRKVESLVDEMLINFDFLLAMFLFRIDLLLAENQVMTFQKKQ